MAVNPVDQAVIAQGLIAAAREMGVKLVRSAYSPVVREANDCSAALLDRHGNVVAQAELIPMQLGPIGTTFAPCAELYPPETLDEAASTSRMCSWSRRFSSTARWSASRRRWRITSISAAARRA